MPDVTEISALWRSLLEADRRRRQGCDRTACLAALRSNGLTDETSALRDMFLPIVMGGTESDRNIRDVHVIAQMGTSLDGRIATDSGHSHYINGPENIVHLHRLRALSDAVIVGAETVVSDDARLTTRHVKGPDPVRVILDPCGRVPPTAAAVSGDVSGSGPPTILLTGPGAAPYPGETSGEGLQETGYLGWATVCRMSEAAMTASGGFRPATVIDCLAARGLSRLFVEGGGRLVSAFLAAGCLDRLHVCVAPMIIGSGRPGLILPPIDRLDEAIRAPAAIHRQGADVLFDLDLRAARLEGDGSR